jgi:hypothetical protein
MESHRLMRWKSNRFKSVTSYQIVKDFSRNGYEGIDKYLTTDNLFIDEVGDEPVGVHFGNRIEVLEIVLLERYNLWQKKGTKTHFTTNLNKEMLANKYGSRFASRMNEMYNFVLLGKNDRDFRKL